LLLQGLVSLAAAAADAAAVVEVDVERDPREAWEPSRWSRGPHRGLLIRLGIGTVDQVLLAAQSVRFGPVRLAGLAGRVVVFDEVHAYDLVMNRLLERVLEWLAQIGCCVVLLSATLPPATRRSLAEAFARGLRGGDPSPDAATPVQAEGYPRVTVVTSAGESVTTPPRSRPRPADGGEVTLRRLALRLGDDDGRDARRLAAEIDALTASDRWGRLGMVCNSVDHAQRVYRVLTKHFAGDDRVQVLLFHSRFPRADRERREAEVLRLFGKQHREARREGLVLLVATQIIEQSLDIDCDLLITEFTVVDLLIQRLGRMRRWLGTPRPGWAGTPVAWLIDPGCDLNGIPALGEVAFVYDRSAPAVLLGSWLELRGRDRLRLPDEVPGLVARVYDAVEQPVPPWPMNTALGQAWDEAVARQQARAVEAADLVGDRLVPEPWDLDAWWRLTGQERDDDLEAEIGPLRAMTRMGDPSLNVVLAYRHPDGVIPVAGAAAGGAGVRESFPLLIASTVALSRKAVVAALRLDATRPPAWRADPVLRHAVLTELDADGTYGRAVFRYSQQLGVLYPDRRGQFPAEADA
jgi:CRISPR-associated endonuclease/helicase Cas3